VAASKGGLMRSNPIIRRLLAAGLVTGLVTGAATPARAVPALKRFRDFAVPTARSGPHGLAAGPDGNLWFTEQTGHNIGRITLAGIITEFTIPTVGSYSYEIADGPDGNLWFTEYYGNKIG